MHCCRWWPVLRKIFPLLSPWCPHSMPILFCASPALHLSCIQVRRKLCISLANLQFQSLFMDLPFEKALKPVTPSLLKSFHGLTLTCTNFEAKKATSMHAFKSTVGLFSYSIRLFGGILQFSVGSEALKRLRSIWFVISSCTSIGNSSITARVSRLLVSI